MPERDANQLAADVRERLRPVQGLDGVQCQCEKCVDNAAGFSALNELVALVGTLQQERDAERRWCKHWSERAEAAEARAETLQQERDRQQQITRDEMNRCEEYTAAYRKAESELEKERVGHAGQKRLAEGERNRADKLAERLDEATSLASDAVAGETKWRLRAEAAEAALATTRQALAPFVEFLNPDALMQGAEWPGRFREYQGIARRALADTGGDTKEPA